MRRPCGFDTLRDRPFLSKGGDHVPGWASVALRRGVVASLLLLVATACADGIPTSVTPDSAALSSAVAPATAVQQEPPFVPGRVLARFQPGVPAADIATAVGAAIQGEVTLDIQMLSVPEGLELQVVQALSANPNVEFAEPDYIRTFGDPSVMPVSDPYIGYKWDLDNDGNIYNSTGSVVASTGAADADIDWREAYEYLGGSVSGSAIIGIIDSGIRQDHEEIAGRIHAQYDFWDNDGDPADDHGHGTHVAGTAAGSTSNGVGVAGVSFANTQFAIAKVCGPTIRGPFVLGYGCSSSAIANGITWAVDNGANVLNLSLGGSSASSSEQSALQYARGNDVLPFCATGNNNGAVLYPAAFPECVAIGATDWNDDRSSYSNYGPEVDLSAPGGDTENPNAYSYILSSYYESSSSYAFMVGTSMATPQATGLAALLHALGTTDDGAKLDLMENTADDLGPAGRDDEFGYGRINAYNAVTGAGGGADPGNDPPAANDVVISGDEDTVIPWVPDGSDPNGDPLTCSIVSQPANGQATVASDCSSGTYTPDGDFDGDDAFAYSVSDASASDQGTVTVTVNPVNDAPVASGDAYGATVGVILNVAAPGVLANDEDVDGDALTAVLDTGPSNAVSFSLSSDGSFSYESDGTTGDDSFSYHAHDGNASSNIVTVTISVSEPSLGGISLAATGYKVRGLQKADLVWSGATGTNVDVWRDGILIVTTANDDFHTDNIDQRGGGSYTYQVCEAGTGTCSNGSTVNF